MAHLYNARARRASRARHPARGTYDDRRVTEDVLERAEALLRAGWLQGRLSHPASDPAAYCLVGAVCTAGMAETDGREIVRAYALVGHAIRLLHGELPEAESGLLRIARWNDAPGRRESEVLQVVTLSRHLATSARRRAREGRRERVIGLAPQ